jgi:lipopolysaccharide export system permease protein
MPLTSRYMFNNLILVTLFLAATLIGAVWLIQSVQFVEMVVRNLDQDALFTLGKLSFLLLPDLVSLILPIAVFIAVLLVYTKFIADRELLILRGLGMSNWELAKPVILMGTIAMVLLYAINIYFLPKSFQTLRGMESTLKNRVSISFLQEGVFNDFPGLTLFMRKRGKNGELSGILAYINRDNNPPYTLTAEQGSFVRTPEGPNIIMKNGSRQEFDPNTGKLSILYFDQTVVALQNNNNTQQSRLRKPSELFLPELFSSTKLDGDSTYRKRLRAEGHQRLLSPLYPLAFALMGAVLILLGSFSRRTDIRRPLYATCCVIVIQALCLVFFNLSGRFPIFIPFAYASVILPILVCLYLLSKGSDKTAETPKRLKR